MSKIEQELLSATSLAKKGREPRQKFLARLVQATYKLKDDDWEGLSTVAQKWYNDAAEAKKSNDEIPDFSDEEEVVGEEDTGEESPSITAEPPEAPEKSNTNTSTTKRGPRRASACHTIKTLVVKKPSISVKELSTKLSQKGLKVSDVTISSLRSDTRDTLRVLNELEIGSFEL